MEREASAERMEREASAERMEREASAEREGRGWKTMASFPAGLRAVATAASLAIAMPTSAATKAIKAGRLIDPAGEVITDAVVVVDNDRIASVGTGAPPVGAEVIDLGTLTIIPGLIDVHTHMTYYWDRAPGTRPLDQPRRPTGVTTVLAFDNARRTLETGVTTVRDLGASNEVDYAMRDLINMGRMIGPRMFVAGQGLSAGRDLRVDPDAFREQAEARIAAGADWIKIFGSRGSFQSVETTQTVPFEAMKAVVDAAHAKNHRVAIHSYGPSGVKDAVRAGADSVEHGIDLDDETLAEMVRRGTVWVPTIDHNRYYVEARDEYGFAPETIPPLQAYIEKNLESARRAVKAGVRIAMGSDAVFSMFGQNTRELGWFVKAGMTPAQALASATTVGAALLGHERDLGAIAPGYFADIAAIDGDPLSDVNVLINRIVWVMKGGAVVVDKRAGEAGRAGQPSVAEASAQVVSRTESAAAVGAADESAVRQMVEQFLLHLGNHEFDKVAAGLASKALIVVTRQRDGAWTNSYQTGEEWIAALKRNPNPTMFREPITNVKVTIDSDQLAYVRADFQVLRDGAAQSHGVDHFTLVREPSGWKIAVVAYTSLPGR
jgi:imidazolonepropionase-like amidohydrolase